MANTTLRAAEAELFPAANNTDNDNLNDVVGNKTDAAQTTVGTTRSLMGYLKGVLNTVLAVDTDTEIILDHLHGVNKVYPSLATGISPVSAGTAWTLGNFIEVVPANTITTIYDIHFIKVEGFDKTGTYCLVLYEGASDIEVGRCRITRDSNSATFGFSPFMTPLIAANARIRAKLAHSGALAATLTFSISLVSLPI